MNNTGEEIFAVTENGRVFSTNPDLVEGDFSTVGADGVEAVGIASHPERNGYWLLD